MTSRSASIVLIALIASFIAPVHGDAFLKGDHHSGPKGHVSQAEVQSSLLAEIEGTFGAGSATSRLNELETLLHPMYVALPKNEHGGLGHATVRYALHRLFVQRHGWSIKGIDPAGDSWNSTSPAGILKDQVPAYIQELFEKRLGDRGFGLHELAVFAATIEHLIHTEATQRLDSVMQMFNMLVTDSMTGKQADELLDIYMVSYILGEDLNSMTLEDARSFVAEMEEIYAAWPETQEFVYGIRRNMSKSDELSFTTLVRVAEKVGEQFGKFQDTECRQLKGVLVASEANDNTGRVPLSDFYKPNLDGNWQFRESVDYLRDLGVLDESDPKRPRVMLANYIGSQSNCIASSSFYEVCCMNECESLLGHIEQQVAAPQADPAYLLTLVAKLSSSSVQAPRKLSEMLSSQLHDIAIEHAGTVPLHGRLFAQWLHHAFPRECKYPHVAGTIRPRNPDDWDQATGYDSQISIDEVLNYHESHIIGEDESAAEDVDTVLPWSHEEELLVIRPEGPRQATTNTDRSPSMLFFAGVVSVVFGVVHAVLKPGQGQMSDVHMDKLFV